MKPKLRDAKHLEYGSLVGKEYGNLIVESVHTKFPEVKYLCKCKLCGHYIVLRHWFLKRKLNPYNLDCGCTKRGHIQNPEKIEGKRFGKLVINEYLYIENQEYYYAATCDCGNEVIVTWRDLKNRDVQSCGCLYRSIQGTNVVYDSDKMKATPGVSNPAISEYYKEKYKERNNTSEAGYYIKSDGTITDENGLIYPFRFRVDDEAPKSVMKIKYNRGVKGRGTKTNRSKGT